MGITGRCIRPGWSLWPEQLLGPAQPDPTRVVKGRVHIPTPIPSPSSGEGGLSSGACLGLGHALNAILRPMLLRTDPLRVAVYALGLAFVLILGAYGFASIESRPTLGGIVSALAALAIAGSGLPCAWRLGNAGIVD